MLKKQKIYFFSNGFLFIFFRSSYYFLIHNILPRRFTKIKKSFYYNNRMIFLMINIYDYFNAFSAFS